MNERFFDLKKDRQDRIINGAMRIFAQNGYRHASTDEMVAAASISKGLLFHYFKSKKRQLGISVRILHQIYIAGDARGRAPAGL